jgi:uncharacterized protein YegP (UPF0339 family)
VEDFTVAKKAKSNKAKSKKRQWSIDVVSSQDGKRHWLRLTAGNGEIVLKSSETYDSFTNATRALKTVTDELGNWISAGLFACAIHHYSEE